jgi:hypothetical protein
MMPVVRSGAAFPTATPALLYSLFMNVGVPEYDHDGVTQGG